MQDEVVVTPFWLRVQPVAEKLPVLPDGPDRLKLTVPDGADFVPPSASLTVTVQRLPWLTKTGLSQETLVEVERRVTVSAKTWPPAAVEPAWTSLELPDGL